MQTYLIANPKGGVGKSTLATNLAGYFARAGHRVMLGDIDRQQSSRTWLSLRSPMLPPIASWELANDSPAKPPKDTTHVVLDTPAGLHGKTLSKVLKQATRVVVPLQASMFDILATREFLLQLAEEKKACVSTKAIPLSPLWPCASTRAHVRQQSWSVFCWICSCRSLPICATRRIMSRPQPMA